MIEPFGLYSILCRFKAITIKCTLVNKYNFKLRRHFLRLSTQSKWMDTNGLPLLTFFGAVKHKISHKCDGIQQFAFTTGVRTIDNSTLQYPKTKVFFQRNILAFAGVLIIIGGNHTQSGLFFE